MWEIEHTRWGNAGKTRTNLRGDIPIHKTVCDRGFNNKENADQKKGESKRVKNWKNVDYKTDALKIDFQIGALYVSRSR